MEKKGLPGSENTERLIITCPPDLKVRIKVYSATTKKRISTIIREAVNEYFINRKAG